MTNEKRDEMLIEIHSDMKAMVKTVESLVDTVWGNPGLELKVDRLEVFKKVSCWFLAALTLGGISVAVKLVYDALSSA